ncbi:MAG: putative FAD-linked oxidoreductase [Burkholderiaceae bacterium]|nr:putative FAD-linked oxidoreductase [Burkholderiaceae bacterium]
MSTFTPFLTALRALIGAPYVRMGADATGFHTDERNRYHHAPLAVVLPDSVAQISTIVQLCGKHGVAIIAQGGNTGLVGGCAVLENTPSIILNLNRLSQIISIDALNQTMTVQAGATLAQVQAAARAQNLLFPLSLASEDSATIGGNLATNAGGTQVLCYGTMRDLCLGLEVVLADGQVLSALNTLRKNNTGYDLKHLFIGAEGTLGIITQAVLKLYPMPATRQVALIACNDLHSILTAFTTLRQNLDARLTAFEMIAPYALSLVCSHLNCVHPWQSAPMYTALIEISQPTLAADETLHTTLVDLMATQTVQNTLIAENLSQAEQFWRMREQISAAQKAQGKNIKHDVSVPISAIAQFIEQTNVALAQKYHGIQTVVFGHMGDGNVHYNVSMGTAFANADALMAHESTINQIVYEHVQAFNGSISAEHGIGLLKRDLMPTIKSKVELKTMHAIKKTLDPNNLMNPHKIFNNN